MTTSISSEIGNNIDLLTEILLRLEVKPLVRFKCVSKQWFSLISNPQFCLSHNRHHHHHHHTPSALLLRDNIYPPTEFETVPLRQDIIPKVPSFDYLNAPCLCIIQSCNGLLLCSSQFMAQDIYYICNPTTKEFKTLSFPSSEFNQSLVSVCMAFDPLKSNHYKLICVRELKRNENYQIDMYSSETDSWSLLGITFTASHDIVFAHAVFCNGLVHWYIEVGTSLYYDVERECLNTMPMPDLDNRVVQYFGESRGHLHLIVTKCGSPLQLDVLEMAADYSGWFERYHVNLDAVRITFPDIIWYREGRYRFSVLHVVRAQKEEESVVVLFVDNKAISFDVHNEILKKLFDLEHPEIVDYTWRETFPYVEILTSV